VLLSTWRSLEEQPLIAAITEVAARQFGRPNDTRWSLGDASALRALFAEAGFDDVRVEVARRTDVIDAEILRLNVMAMGFDMAGLSTDDRARRLAAYVAESAPVVARYACDRGFALSLAANIVTAVVPT
jgi:hypothetical protein